NDLGYRYARDVHDVAAVELCHGRRLAGLAYQIVHVRTGKVPQAERADVSHAEVEHAGREPKAAVRGADIAKLLEGEQDATDGGPGETGGRGDLGERHAWAVGVERTNHVEAARERLDEVRALSPASHARLRFGHLTPRRSGRRNALSDTRTI